MSEVTMNQCSNAMGHAGDSTDEHLQTENCVKCESGEDISAAEEEERVTDCIKKEPHSHSCSPERCDSTSDITNQELHTKQEEIVQNIHLPEFVHCNGSFPGTSNSSVYVKQEAVTEKSSDFQPVLCSIKRYHAMNSPFATRNLKFLSPPEMWKSSAWVPTSPKVTRRIDETEEQYNERCMKLKLRYLKWLKNESPNHREERLRKMRDRGKTRRGKETEEQRENRLRKLRLRQTHRLINETHEQKAHRLQQMRMRAAHRLANETPEQREIRLSKMRQNAAKRLANETPEEREVRLSMLRSYRSRHLAGKVRKLKNSYFSQLSSDVQDCGVSLNDSNYLTRRETLEVLHSSQDSLSEGNKGESMYTSHSTTETNQ